MIQPPASSYHLKYISALRPQPSTMPHIQLLNSKAAKVSRPLHRYEALREKDEIRLLVLEPGPSDRDIRCTLRHARLSEEPKYEASLYMWGSEEYPILLDVGGHKRLIRNNLWQALKHLRYSNKERILWVDAICIDQGNDKERGHQVAQMSEIYAQATSVRLWLGLDDDDGSVRATFDHLKNWRRIGHRP